MQAAEDALRVAGKGRQLYSVQCSGQRKFEKEMVYNLWKISTSLRSKFQFGILKRAFSCLRFQFGALKIICQIILICQIWHLKRIMLHYNECKLLIKLHLFRCNFYTIYFLRSDEKGHAKRIFDIRIIWEIIRIFADECLRACSRSAIDASIIALA